jgi:hypothetical protein
MELGDANQPLNLEHNQLVATVSLFYGEWEVNSEL